MHTAACGHLDILCMCVCWCLSAGWCGWWTGYSVSVLAGALDAVYTYVASDDADKVDNVGHISAVSFFYICQKELQAWSPYLAGPDIPASIGHSTHPQNVE